MPRSREERLAYQRGYNRGRVRISDHIGNILRIARGYRDRLTDINPQHPCDGCMRWTHGGGGCVWGRCAADFQWGSEPRMWAEPKSGSATCEIITTPDFGCVNWLPRR